MQSEGNCGLGEGPTVHEPRRGEMHRTRNGSGVPWHTARRFTHEDRIKQAGQKEATDAKPTE